MKWIASEGQGFSRAESVLTHVSCPPPFAFGGRRRTRLDSIRAVVGTAEAVPSESDLRNTAQVQLEKEEAPWQTTTAST